MNTYGYVDQNPLSWVDPYGLAASLPNPNGIVPGSWSPAGAGQKPGTFFGPKQNQGGRAICRYVPSGAVGNNEAYWKTQTPGQKGWTRYSGSGSQITPEQAHPNKTNSGNPRGPSVLKTFRSGAQRMLRNLRWRR